MNKIDDIELLFREHYSALCMYSIHIVSDTEVAEDVVMDCFMKLYEKIKQGEKILSAKNYIYLMVRNASIDYCKHNKQSTLVEDVEYDVIDDNEEMIERSEREARLWKEIGNLPESCRNVFLLSKRDGMKNREIAEKLHISIKTVEAHISKAYSQLRGKAREIYLMFF